MSDAEQDQQQGVDRTLIRWMLSLTPDERLAVAEDYINDIEALRNAWKAARQPEGSGRT
jgi:hypothetical protein